LFEDAKALLSRSVDKKIDIKIRQEPSLWLIDGDSTQLFQVLMNLGINARDAMVGGGELIFEATNICIENNHSFSAINLKPGKYVCVAARDTGVGIPRDIQKKIFEPFFTTKEKGKGTGLGLAMVYGIVKSHGGAISLYSELGKGTEFRIYLPAADELETSQRLASSDEPDFYADKLKGRVILIADDEDVLRQYLRKVLEPLGAILLFAKDGKEAVDLFEAHKDKLDCAILDVIMPKMRGIDVYKELRRRSPRRIKVVFSSGYADNPEIADLLKGTDVDFIVKPFKLTALLRKLNL
jgi:CheY-like chemotaxis protein